MRDLRFSSLNIPGIGWIFVYFGETEYPMPLPVYSADQIRAIDAFTMANEPVSSMDLMERTAAVCLRQLLPYLNPAKKITVCCGSGNNGGDGFVIARLLQDLHLNTEVFLMPFSPLSDDCALNLEKISGVRRIGSAGDFPVLKAGDQVIDALFGVGLNRKPEGLAADLIMHINNSGAAIFCVDMPSGLPADVLPDHNCIIRAKRTVTFQFPKLTFLLPETAAYAGDWEIADIGLIVPDDITSGLYVVQSEDVVPLFPERPRFSHKGTYGHGLLVAGSFGKAGAAILSATAALRSGIGLLTVHTAGKNIPVVQATVPEAMCLPEMIGNTVSTGHVEYGSYTAIGCGPGLGTEKFALSVLEQLADLGLPSVIDADALNLIASYKELLRKFDSPFILTPHPKEFERLFGETENSSERLRRLRQSAQKYACVIVLKDAVTAAAMPDGRVFFNVTGNPGMATGGSGDVLTGILLGLLAQGLSAEQAALAGVYYHGKAGDAAALMFGEYTMKAGDIIRFLRFP